MSQNHADFYLNFLNVVYSENLSKTYLLSDFKLREENIARFIMS